MFLCAHVFLHQGLVSKLQSVMSALGLYQSGYLMAVALMNRDLFVSYTWK